MKRRFTLLIAMVMLLTAMATNVFASLANNNSKVSPKEWQEWFNGLSKEEQLSVNYEPSQVLKALSANEVSKVNIDDKYETKTFLTELQNLYPTMGKKSINLYISSYIEIFNMYRGMYPNLSNKAIAEKAKANVLNKIEYMIDDSKYEAKDIIIRSAKEPDGYEAIVDYINKNLKPNYYATLDTTEENINILKRHINSLPNEVKESALLYIEDMESSEEIYAVECKINYFGEDIQAFYVKDELFIKLRDFLDFFDIQNDSFVKYDGKSNSVILNIQPEILKLQDSIKIKPVKQDGKTKLFKSSHKLIVFSEENKDNGKKHEVKGMQMYLINGANYVAIKEISEIYKIPMSQKSEYITLNTNEISQINDKKFIIDNKAIRYQGINVDVITDEELNTESFILVGKLKEDILDTITKNITSQEPKDPLKNEPYKRTVIVTIKDAKNDDIIFTFIPENKIGDKYYVSYGVDHGKTKYKNLSINVGEKILDLLNSSK